MSPLAASQYLTWDVIAHCLLHTASLGYASSTFGSINCTHAPVADPSLVPPFLYSMEKNLCSSACSMTEALLATTPQALGDCHEVQDAVTRLCCSWWQLRADGKDHLVASLIPYLLVRVCCTHPIALTDLHVYEPYVVVDGGCVSVSAFVAQGCRVRVRGCLCACSGWDADHQMSRGVSCPRRIRSALMHKHVPCGSVCEAYTWRHTRQLIPQTPSDSCAR